MKKLQNKRKALKSPLFCFFPSLRAKHIKKNIKFEYSTEMKKLYLLVNALKKNYSYINPYKLLILCCACMYGRNRVFVKNPVSLLLPDFHLCIPNITWLGESPLFLVKSVNCLLCEWQGKLQMLLYTIKFKKSNCKFFKQQFWFWK